jgi:hypothetical protein
MIVGDGKNTSFWHDKWCGAVSLADKFPSLYEICEDQYCSVAALKQRGWRLKFRRWLHEELQNQLRRLHDLIFCFNTNDEKDVAKWDWEKSGFFSVKSTYKFLCRNDYGLNHNKIWKAKIPLKIKIFMWLVSQEAILTKDNLSRRKGKSDNTCAFCIDKESIHHIFFECMTAKYIWSLLAYSLGADCRPTNMNQFWFWIEKILPQGSVMHAVGLAAMCWAIWRSRNAVCFENKRVKSPTEIVCMMCSFLIYWAGLLTEEWKHQVIQGAEAVKKAAIFFHRQNVQSCA